MRPNLPLSGIERVALIDGDILAYQCGFVHEKNPHFSDLDDLLDETVSDWMRRAFCTSAKVCLTRHRTFRHKLTDTYKCNRADAVRPVQINEILDYLESEHDGLVVNGLEADDLMGIFGTHPDLPNAVIVTVDKDLLQIPGWHFNPKKDDFPWHQELLDAQHNFWLQTMMGDSVDGIKGLPGIGPKRAAKALEESEVGWPQEVADRYQEAFSGLTEHDMTLELVRILSYTDLDPDKHLTDPSDLSWLTI